MNRIYISIILLFFAITMSSNSYSKDRFPTLETRYFGQKPPGLTAEVFAPGLISTEEGYESGVSFSADMRELYFVKRGGEFKERTPVVIRYENQRWGKASVTDIEHPYFSKDGNTLYRRNSYRERTDSGWSEKKSLGPFFKDHPIMGISVSSNGTYYFDLMDREGDGHISYSRLIEGKYEKPQKMKKEINSGKWIAHPFIAPDESYLMWDAERKSGYGDADLYIIFRQTDGSWGAAINMGDKINTASQEGGVRLTPDGKYLTFWRGNQKIREDGTRYWVGSPYWVDAQVIENLRSKQ
ncbi:conserved hypothetical protein [Shewanella denitrificans OS217]|jgi:hypothetical protein|uniref:WD40-like Beta Propeller n=1 Tax=Shewanella denitrificans (strain OS217 / ATCC BAA-1090 / DSM 15013) TaxID=318161 RepID=Q12MF7_SHEDO|nr:PD40 domain-containing protein [Shewanella denitrificans]ABE55369.1 conserved hypothetical protein [Shewanella denitrificans OS217]